ncbi:Ig-like domain-containing protein [Actinospica robiniae]|uniref:Ig-like domain-containing protein n=1 Tax=Actinospica robiniae TaxID=304901 RepID=UPI00040F0BA9|nr:Ig-like domain-containing protein [Actinospica robiniae]
MLAVLAFASPAVAAVSSSTTVQASPSSATTGQSVALTAMVSCTGDLSGGLGMTFFDGGDELTTVPVAADGSASYSTSFSTTGTHTITAAYNGNDNCDASNNTTTVQVTEATEPSTPSAGLCLLFCNGLIDLTVQNVGNVGNAGDIYNDGRIGGVGNGAGASIGR